MSEDLEAHTKSATPGPMKAAPAAAGTRSLAAPLSSPTKAPEIQPPAAPMPPTVQTPASLSRTGNEAGKVQTPDSSSAAAPTQPSNSDVGDTAVSGSPWDTPVNAAAKDYTVVTVFYGTDRKALAVSDARVDGYDGWFCLTAICAAATMGFAVVSLRYSQSRKIRAVTYSGLAITVLLGTATTMARLQSEELNPGTHIGYGNDRSEVQVGTCQVSIPKYHETGAVERPSILRLDFYEDPRKHVVLLNVEQESPDEFYAAMKSKVQSSQQHEAFVFVHGYNVTFEDAARRTAQLAYDLKFDGAAAFFSWPSQGGLLQYAVDETNVAWTVPHLKDFMVSVARQSGAKSVHLIAHSMGNRALTSALLAVAAEMKGENPIFREVVLTAPDIDADVFKRDIAPAITHTANRVTLYASSNDEALALSKRLHGYPRAGDSGTELIVVDGVETIDVSNVDTSLLGHSYYGSNDTVLADLFYVLTEPKPAHERSWLEPVPIGQLVYWVFQREAARLRAATGQEKAVR
jgi:esterase/lipase superfamily enzyme